MTIELTDVKGNIVEVDMFPGRVVIMAFNAICKDYTDIEQAIDELLISKN